MKLLTKTLRKKVLKAKRDNEKIICKFFNPAGSWNWYVLSGELANENDPDGDVYFYGYVEGFENEFGIFSLSELESIKLPFGLGIERDLYFSSVSINKIMKI